jgi:DNA-binding NarL/FixJ family response regulator
VDVSRAGHGQGGENNSEYDSPGMSPSQILITLLEKHMTDIANLREALEAERSGVVLEMDEEKFDELTKVLSERDRELARDMVLVGDNKAIAEKLGYSPGTIKTRATRIVGKIGVKNRDELRKIVLRLKQ